MKFEANFFDLNAARVAEPLSMQAASIAEAVLQASAHIATLQGNAHIIEVTVEEVVEEEEP